MKEKEQALNNWLDMIYKSWTWAKLTNEERSRFLTEIDNITFRGKAISGTYDQRWVILGALYSMFLQGCGYMPIGWRE